MEDFIVRIYRRKLENGGLFGVVEKVGDERRQAFRNMRELMHLLRGDTPGESHVSDRIPFAIQGRVEGNDAAGKPFSEETLIELTRCLVRLRTRVREGEELQLAFEPACRARTGGARVASVAQGPAPRIVEVIFGQGRATDTITKEGG